ncbi:MAG: zinc-ribbon domain-containing protein [Ruminococcus sp.]|nr:zinc-ribbon domain-containing protein [Ruminococcus sp.]
MELKDKKITCKDCGKTFLFTVNDQEFYAKMGFNSDPQRCKDCRAKKKAEKNSFRKTNSYSSYRNA